MRRSVRLAIWMVLIASVVPPVVPASDSELIAHWRGKMQEAISRAPFALDFTTNAEMNTAGLSARLVMTGRSIYAERNRHRTTMDQRVEGIEGMPPMEIKALIVADGETLWMEMDNPLLGGKQVMKLAANRVDALSEGGGGQGHGKEPPTDPLTQIDAFFERFDIREIEKNDGVVTLQGVPKDGGEGAADVFFVTLDGETGFPKILRVEGDQKVTIEFGEPDYLDAGDLDPATFTYAPPPGAPVVDLESILGGR